MMIESSNEHPKKMFARIQVTQCLQSCSKFIKQVFRMFQNHWKLADLQATYTHNHLLRTSAGQDGSKTSSGHGLSGFRVLYPLNQLVKFFIAQRVLREVFFGIFTFDKSSNSTQVSFLKRLFSDRDNLHFLTGGIFSFSPIYSSFMLSLRLECACAIGKTCV